MKDLKQIIEELQAIGYADEEITELIKDKEKLIVAIEFDLGYFIKEVF